MRAFRVLEAVLCLVLSTAGVVDATDRFVSTRGGDAANDCTSAAAPCRSIGHAIDVAVSGDEIRVARGVYRENLVIAASTVLRLTGGWSNDFTSRSLAGAPTAIDARRLTGLRLDAGPGEAIDVVLDGITVKLGTHGIWAEPTGDGVVDLELVDSVLVAHRFAAIVAANRDSGRLGLRLVGSLVARSRIGVMGNEMFDALTGTTSVEIDVTEGTRFERNQLGGIRLVQAGSSTARVWVSDSIMKANKDRGAVSVDADGDSSVDVRLVNSVFVENRNPWQAVAFGTRGGALGVETGDAAVATVSVESCTFTRNVSEYGGGAMAVRGLSSQPLSFSLTNTIAWGNRSRFGAQDVSTSGVSSTASDVGDVDGPVVDLGGNVSINPRLAGPLAKLSAGSPVIDAGTCAGAPSTDFEGDPRPTGAGCDIGADEFVP